MKNECEKPIRKIYKASNYEEEYFLCPKCGEELEYGEQIIDAMYDDIVSAGESEVNYFYCPNCDWDNEKQACDNACDALGGLFWY